eukprot:scaffold76498_cov75-Phaeocystis_antarctica.AAC.1
MKPAPLRHGVGTASTSVRVLPFFCRYHSLVLCVLTVSRWASTAAPPPLHAASGHLRGWRTAAVAAVAAAAAVAATAEAAAAASSCAARAAVTREARRRGTGIELAKALSWHAAFQRSALVSGVSSRFGV